jgi:hypothetical protein
MSELWRKLRLVLLATAALAYAVLDHLASSSSHLPVYAVLAVALNFAQLLAHTAWLYFFQHPGNMTGLGIKFGSTLDRHEGPFGSRIARTAIAKPLDGRTSASPRLSSLIANTRNAGTLQHGPGLPTFIHSAP